MQVQRKSNAQFFSHTRPRLLALAKELERARAPEGGEEEGRRRRKAQSKSDESVGRWARPGPPPCPRLSTRVAYTLKLNP
jgi:hypothetical protein